MKIDFGIWVIVISAVIGGAGGALAEERNEHRPVFSPDGSKIIFMSMSGATNGDWELYMMAADGSNPERLTNHPGWDGYAVWSPGGKTIFFDRALGGSDGGKTPYWRDLAVGETRRLGEYEGWLSINDWSPTGQLLAFWERDGQRDLYLFNPDGSIVRRLTETPDVSEHDAHFSPDGGRIAFSSQAADGTGRSNLEMIDLGAQNRRVLHNSGGGIYGIDWSPDGSAIAFTDAPGGEEDDADIFVITLSDGTIRQLTNNSSWDHMPEWRPDGQQLLFTSYRSGEERIYAIDVSSGTITPFCIEDFECAADLE